MTHVGEFILTAAIWVFWIWVALILAFAGLLICYGVCRCLEGRRRSVPVEELDAIWALPAAQDGPRRVG